MLLIYHVAWVLLGAFYGEHGLRRFRSMIYSVKQLTDGFCCITEWHGSGFTWLFPPDEQKKLKRLILHQAGLGFESLGAHHIWLDFIGISEDHTPLRVRSFRIFMTAILTATAPRHAQAL
jgi:hypothetical protein